MKSMRTLTLVALLVGCTPIAQVEVYGADFGAAKERRRVVALASPT